MDNYISIHPTRRALHGIPLGKGSVAINGRVRSAMGVCWFSLNTPHGVRLPYARDAQPFGVMCMTNPIADSAPLPEVTGEEKELARIAEMEKSEAEREEAAVLKKSLDTGKGLAYIFTKNATGATTSPNALAFDGTTVSFGGMPGHPDTLFEVHCVGLVGDTEYYNFYSILHKKYISFGPRGLVVDTKEDSQSAVAITLALRAL